ncbi:MAG TPA: hypothetical protein VL179_13665, partial [Mycobacterium sp.]|nr:hypothetical protein [Mycobacterium sp.]
TPGLATYLLQIPSLTSAAASTSSSSFSGLGIVTTNHALAVNALRDDAQGIGPFQVGSPWPATPVVAAPRPPVSALLGEASLTGRLAVPQSWAATVRPTLTSAPAALALVPAAVAAPIGESTFASGMFGEALLGSMAGRGVSNTAAKRRRRGVKDTLEAPRTPATG